MAGCVGKGEVLLAYYVSISITTRGNNALALRDPPALFVLDLLISQSACCRHVSTKRLMVSLFQIWIFQ